VTMVNHLLETSHPLSSSAPRLTVPAPHPSSILRTHFQVPYPVSPLLATLTKTPGGCGGILPISEPAPLCVQRFNRSSSALRRRSRSGRDVQILPWVFCSPAEFTGRYQRFSLPPYFLTSFLPPAASRPLARWTDCRMREIILIRRKRWWGRLSQRRK